MTSEGTLITLGILTMLLPFAGLPSGWFFWILPVFGLLISLTAYFLRKKRMAQLAVKAAEQQTVIVEEEVSVEEGAARPLAF